MVLICLTAILTPFLTALAISEGLKSETQNVLESGPDLYVTQDHFGSNAPISLDYIPQFSALPGIKEVIPRIIGRTYLNTYFLAVLGIAPAHLPSSIHITQGRAFQNPGEVLLGEKVSRECQLPLGQSFFLSRNPKQRFKIVGQFQSSFEIWNSDLLIMSFEDGAKLYQLPGKATDLMIRTYPSHEKPAAEKIVHFSDTQTGGPPPLRVQTRTLIKSYVLRGLDAKAGIFSGIYSLAFFLAIPILLVTTGLGLSRRKKEIGISKALGWQTQEILLVIGIENMVLALGCLPVTLLFSLVWIRGFNGFFLNRFFVANVDILPPFTIPAEMFPIPFLLTFFLALILTLTGSLYSTWRIAVAPPNEAMRG